MTSYSLLAQIILAFLFLVYLIIFFIDLKHFIIPDSLNFGLIFFAFIKNFFPDLNLNFTQNLEAVNYRRLSWLLSLFGQLFNFTI